MEIDFGAATGATKCVGHLKAEVGLPRSTSEEAPGAEVLVGAGAGTSWEEPHAPVRRTRARNHPIRRTLV
jgi:hypothetical protein